MGGPGGRGKERGMWRLREWRETRSLGGERKELGQIRTGEQRQLSSVKLRMMNTCEPAADPSFNSWRPFVR